MNVLQTNIRKKDWPSRAKAFVKGVLRQRLPAALELSHARGMRKHFRAKFLARQRRSRSVLFGGNPPEVLCGPFARMRYLDETVWGPIEPKWIGTYEHELIPAVEEIKARHPSVIIDVGSAEGYYSVGFARTFPDVKVWSFDVDPWARAQQRRLAKQNGVQNLTIRNKCDDKELGRLLKPGALIVCDVEGYEYELLDPTRVPEMRFADILVELHETGHLSLEEGSAKLRGAFERTHEITRIHPRPAEKSAMFQTVRPDVLEPAASELTDECRTTGQEWLWCKARDKRGA